MKPLPMLLALACACATLLVGPTVASARPFSPTSVWNQPLPADAPLDEESPGLVSELVRQVTDQKPWINTWQYSSPVYTVPADQRRVRVRLDADSRPLAEAFASVPLPREARPARGSDAQLVVWQPATDSMWEFWKLAGGAGGWQARWGGRMRRVSRNPGYFLERNWGATATGLPLLGGLITRAEVYRGRIDHALALGVTRARSGVWSWPAQRTDGATADPAAIPEGARFRLDPRLDLEALGLPRATRMIAEAAQRYGIVVRDKTGGPVAFEAEDATRFAVDPYYGEGGWYQGRSPSELLATFPWRDLRALRLDLRSRSAR